MAWNVGGIETSEAKSVIPPDQVSLTTTTHHSNHFPNENE